MDNTTLSNEWFQLGLTDFQAAQYLCEMQPMPKEIICYHCEQCVEKLLKGYIALNGGELIKTHDLVALNKRCIHYEPKFKSIMDFCIDLVDYGVNVRYPYHFELTEDDVTVALKNTHEIMEFIKTNTTALLNF